MACSNFYNWEINVGEGVNWSILITDASGNYRNLSGFSVKSQIRSYPDGALIFEMSDINGKAIINTSESGRIDISLSPYDTSGLTPAVANYDLFLIQSGTPSAEKIIHGRVDILSSITDVSPSYQIFTGGYSQGTQYTAYGVLTGNYPAPDLKPFVFFTVPDLRNAPYLNSGCLYVTANRSGISDGLSSFWRYDTICVSGDDGINYVKPTNIITGRFIVI